ncbi:hypothetical protein GBAR_LOCUS15291 [Geodia barretti]|uniref:Uncharacterized protein n=1 Tax=Geodia barretti TaxID=519541 RepID=A0AA35SD29_GEOBA|nr:hypothetical protein GBAR_LOCUS15291 [Geodia barretti]
MAVGNLSNIPGSIDEMSLFGFNPENVA